MKVSDFDEESFRDFLSESNELLASLPQKILTLEEDPKNQDTIDEVFRITHSLKGLASFFSLSSVKATAHKLEDLLFSIREHKNVVSPKIIDALFRGCDILKRLYSEVSKGNLEIALTKNEEVFLETLGELKQVGVPLVEILDDFFSFTRSAIEELMEDQSLKDHPAVLRLTEKIVEVGILLSSSAKEDSESQTLFREDTRHKEVEISTLSRTFRIEEEKIDHFMDYVGKLIIVGEMYSYLQKSLNQEHVSMKFLNSFKNTTVDFSVLTNHLQESVLEIRKLPFNTIVKKYPVMVRQLAKSLNKQVELRVSGGDIKIDKRLIEKMDIPLTHILRNAVDHGIETTQKRKALGKQEIGLIGITIETENKFLIVKIQDDGKGLDFEKIKEKALKKGLVEKARIDKLSQGEITDLIFRAGLSTSEHVTEVSGRGVGMDAVMDNLRSISGTIDVQSKEGEGTLITLKSPLVQTVIVIDGLVVKIGQSSFIVPIEEIMESVSLDKKAFSRIEGKGEVVNIRGCLYPLFHLSDFLNIENGKNEENRVVIVINNEGNHYAIVVDEIGEQKKFVLKEMGGTFEKVRYVSGGAILGDRNISLVLDMKALRGAGE